MCSQRKSETVRHMVWSAIKNPNTGIVDARYQGTCHCYLRVVDDNDPYIRQSDFTDDCRRFLFLDNESVIFDAKMLWGPDGNGL